MALVQFVLIPMTHAFVVVLLSIAAQKHAGWEQNVITSQVIGFAHVNELKIHGVIANT